MFWEHQSTQQKDRYIYLLQIIGSLSNLFTDSSTPYLYYRAHENLFCEVFNAKNLSRGDISFDAIKNKQGIGLKTFLNNNGLTFQKVAEFNSESNIIRSYSSIEEIVYKIAEFRNKRITITQNLTDTNENIYHLITRDQGKMNIVETPMDLIDINSIEISKKQSKNTIRFKDKLNEYSFSLSKNTLLKRFDTRINRIIESFDVSIIENPFELLIELRIENFSKDKDNEGEYIILPLYSPRDGLVQEKSGLNQWNAGGRLRHPNEVYVPIPIWIHDVFSDFFVYSRDFRGMSSKDSPSFNVELPNGKILNCKIAQANGKALMSNPNKALGEWLLRDVLKLKEGELLTITMLDEIGIDSIKITKKDDNYYYLDFMKTGSYEVFYENNYIEK